MPPKKRKPEDSLEPPEAKKPKTESSSDSDDILDESELISDTEVALKILRDSFFPTPLECPIMLVHQVYSMVHDRTAVDEDLDQLKRDKLRIIKVGLHRDRGCYPQSS